MVENGEALLIDAGLRGSSGTILQGLETLGLFPEQIGMVVITHAHPDHSGGLSRLVAGREIAVAVHRLEADIIAGTTGPPSPLQNGLIGKMTQPVFSRLMGSPVPVDDRFEDGDVIPFGTEVRVVHLPGHTEGSIGQTKGPSSLETHCTSSPAHSARRRLESPSDRRRLCGRLRSSWAWTSVLQSLPSHAYGASRSSTKAHSTTCCMTGVVGSGCDGPEFTGPERCCTAHLHKGLKPLAACSG